jgi:prepilin-type N-terminal cleavage/methylation domain-containing protein
MSWPKQQRGFTLVELVLVIVITGIIAGMIAVFIQKPIEGYFDTVRRAALSEEADAALRFVARDLRSALPNSIACAAGSVSFVAIRSGGRFREAQTAANGGTPLAFGSASTTFDFIGSGAAATTSDARGNAVAGQASRVVVGNLGSGVDACNTSYATLATASNAATLSALAADSATFASATYPLACELASPTLVDDASTTDRNEINDREFGRFYIVDSTPVVYLCDNNINGLTRNGVALVALSHVSACQIACDQTKERVQLMTFNLTLRDRQNELVTLLRRVTIVNRP